MLTTSAAVTPHHGPRRPREQGGRRSAAQATGERHRRARGGRGLLQQGQMGALAPAVRLRGAVGWGHDGECRSAAAACRSPPLTPPYPQTALIFTALVTPYEIALVEATRRPRVASPLFILNRIVDLVFTVDMVLSMFRWRQIGGTTIKDCSENFWAYIKSWFPIDIVSVIPFDLVSLAYPPLAELKMMRMIRLLRLLKLARTMRISRMLSRWEAKSPLSYVKARGFWADDTCSATSTTPPPRDS